MQIDGYLTSFAPHLLGNVRSDDLLNMQPWPEDFAALGLREVLDYHAENTARSRALRIRTNNLVNNRLAREITHAEYSTDRERTQGDIAECRRRAGMLEAHIAKRTSILDHADAK